MAEKKEKPWSLKGCNGDETKIRERCRAMGLKDLEELQAKLEDALGNQLLHENHANFRNALVIANEVLEARHARMNEAAKRDEPGLW